MSVTTPRRGATTSQPSQSDNPALSDPDPRFRAILLAVATGATPQNVDALAATLARNNVTTVQELDALISKAATRDYYASVTQGALGYAMSFGVNNLAGPTISKRVEEFITNQNLSGGDEIDGGKLLGAFAHAAIPAFGATAATVSLARSGPRFNPVEPPKHVLWGVHNDPLYNAASNTPFGIFTTAYAIAQPAAELMRFSPVAVAGSRFVAGLLAASRRAHDTWTLLESKKISVLVDAEHDDTKPRVQQRFLDATDLGATERNLEDLSSNWHAIWDYAKEAAHGLFIKSPEAVVTAITSPNSYGQLLALAPSAFFTHLASVETDPVRAEKFKSLANGALIGGLLVGWAGRTEISKILTGATAGYWTHLGARRVGSSAQSVTEAGVSYIARLAKQVCGSAAWSSAEQDIPLPIVAQNPALQARERRASGSGPKL